MTPEQQTRLVHLSLPEQYNSVRDTFLLNSVLNRRILMLNNRPAIFRLFSEKLRRSWEVIVSTQCRRRWATSSTTDAAVSCLRRVPTTARPRPLLPTKRHHYALPSTPSSRDSEAQSTRRRRHPVVDLPAPTTCRRLRHLTDDAVLTPRRANRRSDSYRLDLCSPRARTPLGYTASILFAC